MFERLHIQVQIDGNALAEQHMDGFVSVISCFIFSHMHCKHTRTRTHTGAHCECIYLDSVEAVIGSSQCLTAAGMCS